MTKDNYKKELIRVADKVRELKTECNRVGRAQAVAILALAVAMVMGLFLNFADEPWANFIGFVVAMLSGVAVVVLYAFIRRKGVVNFTVYDSVKKDGKSVTVVAEGKKKFSVLQGDVVLCFDRGTLFLGEKSAATLPWNWFVEADFDECDTPATGVKRYRGKYNGRRALLHVKDGKPDYAEAGGIRMHYFQVNCVDAAASIPQQLYDAAVSSKIELPSFIKSAKPGK